MRGVGEQETTRREVRGEREKRGEKDIDDLHDHLRIGYIIHIYVV